MALRTHNIVAAFHGERKSEKVVRALKDAGIPPSKISVGESGDEALVSKAEMREEVERAWGGPGLSLGTEHQIKGAALWTVVGTILGALVGAGIGVAFFGEATGIAITTVVFAIGGATAGFVGGGLAGPRYVEQAHEQAQESRTDIAVHSEDQNEVERAQAVFRHHEADRIERFDPEGNPVPELHEHSGYEVQPSETGRRLEREKKKQKAEEIEDADEEVDDAAEH